jgi:hypothetical protein
LVLAERILLTGRWGKGMLLTVLARGGGNVGGRLIYTSG